MRILLLLIVLGGGALCHHYLQDDQKTDRLKGKYAATHSHSTRFGSDWDSSSKGWKLERLAWLGHEGNPENILQTQPPQCEAHSESDLDDVSVILEDGFCLAKPIPFPTYQSFLWRLWRDEEMEDFPSPKKLATYGLTDLLQYNDD